MGITYEVRDGIAFLGFDRPEKHNAFRDEDLEALTEGLRRLDADVDANIAILFGNGRSFSSGGDVEARLQQSMDDGSTAARSTGREGFFECEHWKPVIAAVHGYCLGHALATALLCDHLVATRGATFEVTETKIGLAMPSLLGRLGHPVFAHDVVMTGRRFTGEEAWAAGMVTRLVDDGEHLRAAEALAVQILANPQAAVRTYVRVRRAQIAEESARDRPGLSADEWATDDEARAAVAERLREVRGSS